MALNFQQLRLSMLRNGSLLRSLVMSLFIALKHNKSRSDVTLPQFLLLLVHHLLISAQQNNRQWKFLCMTCSLLNLNTRDRTRVSCRNNSVINQERMCERHETIKWRRLQCDETATTEIDGCAEVIMGGLIKIQLPLLLMLFWHVLLTLLSSCVILAPTNSCYNYYNCNLLKCAIHYGRT